MTTEYGLNLEAGGGGIVNRRAFLRSITAGTVALGLGQQVSLNAETLRKHDLACILLWMDGGPSQMDTFDPKPGLKGSGIPPFGHRPDGGPRQAIQTAVTGIQVADTWKKTAEVMKDVALIRTMLNPEQDHTRGSLNLLNGYRPDGALKYPSLPTNVAKEIGNATNDLPNFVIVGINGQAGVFSPGFLGERYAGLQVPKAASLPDNVKIGPGMTPERLTRRVDLMKELERDYAASGRGALVKNRQALYEDNRRLILTPKLKAFDIKQEPNFAKVRERYGNTQFGENVLLARRLVEHGVTFVTCPLGGWDTHGNNDSEQKRLSEIADPALAALISDLKERGRLDRTLVLWTGEFGRTPFYEGANGGRNHYKMFNMALAGCGIKGGQVVGVTTPNGVDVKDRPCTVPDLHCTIYHLLGIDARKRNRANSTREVELVRGGEPIRELFA